MTDIAEYRGKSPDELKEKALELKKELFNLRFQSAAGETANTARYRAVRRDIARVKTALNEPKGLAAPVKKEKKVKTAKPKAEAKATAEAKEAKPKKTTKKKASGE